jgi:hypothetical protein
MSTCVDKNLYRIRERSRANAAGEDMRHFTGRHRPNRGIASSPHGQLATGDWSAGQMLKS